MAWTYGWFAERYGWTPNEVDAQPLWIMRQFPVWAGCVDESQATLQREAHERAERQAAASTARRR